MFGTMHNGSGIPFPKGVEWTPENLDEFCSIHQILWEPLKDDAVRIHGPCG